MKVSPTSIWATRKASSATRGCRRARRPSAGRRSHSAAAGRPGARLGQDHVAQRLRLGQPDRQRRIALAAVDRGDAGPVDLGDVGAVGERQGDPAEEDRVGRQPGERPAPAPRSRSGRSAGSPGRLGTRRPRRSRSGAAERAPGTGWCGSGRARGRRSAPTTSTTMNILTSSQKALRMSEKYCLKTLEEKKVSRTTGQPGLVRISTARPPRTITVEVGGDRQTAPGAAALGRLAHGAAVPDGSGLGHAKRRF